MGFASFLAAVFRESKVDSPSFSGAPDAVDSSDLAKPADTVDSPTHAISADTADSQSPAHALYVESAADSPMPTSKYATRKSSRVTFTLPGPVYAWLEAMAVQHNYGSVHKSVRDLLVWASTGTSEDLEWLFSMNHDTIPCLADIVHACRDAIEPKTIAEKQIKYGPSPTDPVVLVVRLAKSLQRFVASCVDNYGLSGPSEVLEKVCRSVIELNAAEDVFELHDTNLPACTIQLYHDLGIVGPSGRPVRPSGRPV